MANFIGAVVASFLLIALFGMRHVFLAFDHKISQSKFARIALAVLILAFGYVALDHKGRDLILLRQVYSAADFLLLMIHEAGHVYWRFAGTTVMVLGGTLNEVLIPLAFGIYFFLKSAYQGLAVSLLVLGVNLLGTATYITDARAKQLPLYGGAGIHDWEYLLGKAGLLEQDLTIGATVRAFGIAVIVLSALIAVFAPPQVQK